MTPPPGIASSTPGCIHASNHTFVTPHSSPTTTAPKPYAQEVSLSLRWSRTHASTTYGGTQCHSIMMTTHKQADPPDPPPSHTAVASADNANPDTLSGTVRHEETATIARAAITPVKTATTHTPSVSLSRSA